jgi:hypothetical protein
MPGLDPLPFVVGGSYADRNGKYRVISLTAEKMEIEYEDGRRATGSVGTRTEIYRNILREQNIHRPLRQRRPLTSQRESGTYFTHADVFPIIVEIIEAHSRISEEYITHDEIVSAMLDHPEARIALDNCPANKTQQWWASDMVAFFSKVYTERRSEWQGRFDRDRIEGNYAYKLAGAKRSATL